MGYNDFGNPRTTASPYTIDSKIGRRDSTDIVKYTVMTVSSGTPSLVPLTPLGRRNFLRIKNADDTNSVYLLDSATDSYSDGYEITHGNEWEDNTDGQIYIVSTVSGTINVEVYERAARFNYS